MWDKDINSDLPKNFVDMVPLLIKVIKSAIKKNNYNHMSCICYGLIKAFKYIQIQMSTVHNQKDNVENITVYITYKKQKIGRLDTIPIHKKDLFLITETTTNLDYDDPNGSIPLTKVINFKSLLLYHYQKHPSKDTIKQIEKIILGYI
jgi:hypothetical protein